MATNFNVTGLADFVNADPTKALELVILEGKGTKDYFSIETGVKYQTKIPNITNVDVTISAGSISGYNTGDGATVIADVTLQNIQLKIFETYTKEALNKTILASLGKGTDPADLPMESLIVALKAKKLFNENEKLIWQGDTAGAGNLVHFNGVIKQVLAGAYIHSGIIATDFALAATTDVATIAAVKAMVVKMPAEFVGTDMVLAMSPANFSAWMAAKFGLNGVITNQTVGADGKPVMEAFYPGTTVKVVGIPGLVGVNGMILTYPQNIIQVVDLVSEDESLNFIYNPFARWFELAAQYKLGVKVANPDKVIYSAV